MVLNPALNNVGFLELILYRPGADPSRAAVVGSPTGTRNRNGGGAGLITSECVMEFNTKADLYLSI